MRQLALDIQVAANAVFASYHAGRNAAAVDALVRTAAGAGPPIVWAYGPDDVGKSHLMQAGVAAAHQRGAAGAYLPLAVLRTRPPSVVDGMGTLDLVALDDIEAIAGDAGWERALLRLHEDILPRGGRLLLSATAPPAQAGIALPDLRSRFCAAAVFALERLGDEECLQALQLRAEWRGFDLPVETGRFLLSRVERGTGSLFGLLDRLDRAALAAQKKLTVPFVRSVLDQRD